MSSSRSEFIEGLKRSPPIVLASAPFGLLFGALAIENGFTTAEAVLMSATVYAGASQMVGLDLFGQQVAPWLVAFSIFAVNFRHVLYSAAMGRKTAHWNGAARAFGFFFLTDPQYAEAERHAERTGTLSFAWFMGVAVPVYGCWVAESAIGAVFGGLIPDTYSLGLDFLLSIYFLGLVIGFRARPLWLPVVLASGAASILAYETIGSPWHVSVGALAGMVLATMMPIRGARREPAE